MIINNHNTIWGRTVVTDWPKLAYLLGLSGRKFPPALFVLKEPLYKLTEKYNEDLHIGFISQSNFVS